jgi:anion-transporting  ArsA/GET3 family ATPase
LLGFTYMSNAEIEALKKELSLAMDQKNRALDLLSEAKKEKKSAARANFVQIDRESMKSLRELAEQSPTQFRILMVMAEKMDQNNAVMISNKAFQALLGVTRQTISNSVGVLAKNNWLKIMKVGTSNAYFLNSKAFWTDRIDKQRFAEFTATIITTEKEQDISAEDWDSIKVRKVPMLEVRSEERIIMGSEDLPPPDQKDIDLN